MKSLPDPTSAAAWRTLLVAMALTVGATAASLGASTPLLAKLAVVPWAAALLVSMRYAWLGLHRRRAALVVVIIAGVVYAATAFARGGLIAGAILAGLVLLRGVGAHRRLASRHRALAFALAWVVLLLLLVLSPHPGDGRTYQFAQAVRWMLVAFWIQSLLHLMIRMRLHFLRLRPKLAIAGVLIGIVPLLILLVFGLLAAWATLGGSRANRGGDIVASWVQEFARRGELTSVPTADRFVWEEELGGVDAPQWTHDLVTGLRHLRPGGAATADSTCLLDADGAIWLVRLHDAGPGGARLDGARLGKPALDELARVLRADVALHGTDSSPVAADRDETKKDETKQDKTKKNRITVAAGENTVDLGSGLHGTYRPRASGADLWHRPLYFGGSILTVLTFDGARVGDDNVLLTLSTSLADLKDEFVGGRNEFNKAIMFGLGFVAFLLLAIEVFALIFGLRITGGILGAVRELHRGTRRLATGDLDALIEVPNEDELGDLADSFNEMTEAVKEGREHALARQRLQQEMETAREIQTRLLPAQEPLLAGFEVTGKSIPSRQVGGDYFDFLARGDGSLGVAIGDVSGKGMPAALLMANLQASLQGQVIHPASVDEVVERINDLLVLSTDTHMFASFFYGVLDTASGHFTCANAGHNPALLVRADGTSQWLEEGGLLLGMMPHIDYPEVSIDLAPGDVLVLYTDGITEAEAPSPGMALGDDDAEFGEMFGEEGLLAIVQAVHTQPAFTIREAILTAVQNHLAGAPAGDDITLVVIKRTEVAIDATETAPAAPTP